MRHLIDTYIEADTPRVISSFGELGLLELLVRSGMDAVISSLPDGIKGSKDAIAETIANNVRSKIIKEHLNDPAFYDKMSLLLQEVIADLRAKRIDYEDYLKRMGDVAKQVQAGRSDGTPPQLDTSGKRAIYNNLQLQGAATPHDAATERAAPFRSDEDLRLLLALKIDATVKGVRPAGWRNNKPRENVIKAALLPLLNSDVAQVERIFLVIVAQPEY